MLREGGSRNNENEGSAKLFETYDQEFRGTTRTNLKSTAQVAYAVHMMLLKCSTIFSRWMVGNGKNL